MKNKLFSCIASAFLCMLFFGCSWGDKDRESRKIVKDFWLDWMFDSKQQVLIRTGDTTGIDNGGFIEIGATIFAAGANNDFIIVKQHPDFVAADDIKMIGKPQVAIYRLRDASDSIYLPKKDKVFMTDSLWYHWGWGLENGTPDSVFKGITFYYIFDIRKYKMDDDKSYQVYKCKTLAEFNAKRQELGIPATLDFTMVNKEIE